ncbi:hypothetical protein Golomagni_04565 [Golovinomyces magnicellulatus]|nr:hypothetical protein Golomagni_04565 [Golovinomyces magnicellulatus]
MNGVFVQRDNRRLAFRLLEVINEEQEHEWTQEEIEIQKSRGEGFSSKYNVVPYFTKDGFQSFERAINGNPKG